jgi:endoglucanase
MRLAQVDPAGPWNAVLSSLHPLLFHGSGAGFAMDWVLAGTTVAPSLSPAQLAAGIKDEPAVGSYDAIRVYLWLGLSHPSTPKLHQLLADVSGMSAYLKTQPLPPERVDSNGKVLGPNGPAGFSAAAAPFLAALGRSPEAKTQLDRALATRNLTTGLIGHGEYYDQNLALFAAGWSEQRFHFDPKGRLMLPWKERHP